VRRARFVGVAREFASSHSDEICASLGLDRVEFIDRDTPQLKQKQKPFWDRMNVIFAEVMPEFARSVIQQLGGDENRAIEFLTEMKKQ
jgi:hypothetical protein